MATDTGLCIGYCRTCWKWVEDIGKDDKCPICSSLVPKKFTEQDYQKVREESLGREDHPNLIIEFWYTWHAVATPKDLREPIE